MTDILHFWAAMHDAAAAEARSTNARLLAHVRTRYDFVDAHYPVERDEWEARLCSPPFVSPEASLSTLVLTGYARAGEPRAAVTWSVDHELVRIETRVEGVTLTQVLAPAVFPSNRNTYARIAGELAKRACAALAGRLDVHHDTWGR